MASPTSRGFQLAHRLGQLPALLRLVLALAGAGLAYLLLPHSLHLLSRLVAAWDAFALVSLVLLWAAILTADANHIRAVATSEDPGRLWSFVFVVAAALASLLAVVALLGVIKKEPRLLVASYTGLSVLAVGAAWLLVHTLFTLRYAHLFYAAADPRQQEGGLEFPGGEQEPDYLDFAYFAFIIGMTAQTADIGISGRGIRRLALLHGLLSFGFNTAVVALTINGLAGVV